MEPEPSLMITLQPGHGPKPGKRTGNTRDVVGITEHGQTLCVVRHCFVVLAIVQSACSERKEKVSHKPLFRSGSGNLNRGISGIAA